MKAHVQCDLLQGSEEEEITPEFVSLWGKGDGLLYSPHRPWLQITLNFEERAINISATSWSATSLDLLLCPRVSLRSSMCWLLTTKHMEAKWWVQRCEENRSCEFELGTNQVLLLGVFNFQKIIWFPGDLEVEVGHIKL